MPSPQGAVKSRALHIKIQVTKLAVSPQLLHEALPALSENLFLFTLTSSHRAPSSAQRSAYSGPCACACSILHHFLELSTALLFGCGGSVHTPQTRSSHGACLVPIPSGPWARASGNSIKGSLRAQDARKMLLGFLAPLWSHPQVEQQLQVEEVRLRPAVGWGRRPLPVTEGLVEVRLPDGWSQVCDKGWSAHNTRVVCGMLGFPSEKRVNAAFYR